MKRALLLATIGVFILVDRSFSQNVFNPNDLNRRWKDSSAFVNDSTKLTGNPNPSLAGLQKWVSVKTNGVDSTAWGKDFKPYFINLGGGTGARLAFRVKYPFSYGNPDSAGKRYPVMLFFHGAGEPGCPSNGGVYNNEKQMVHGGQTFRNRVASNQYDGYLLYPQLVSANCASDWGSAPFAINYPLVISFLDSLIKYARADIDRVQVFGLSNGGAAAWSMTTAYPQRVAKSTPSSASTAANNYSDFIHIPIWFATGGKDTNPTPGYAQSAFDNISGAGADIRYTRYENLGHGIWNNHWAYPTADVVTDYPLNSGPYPSFLEYMNDIHKANPLVYYRRFDYCPDSAINARIGITPGFYAYEWQKDGVTIATSVNGVNTIIDGSSIISFTGNEITVRSFGTYRVRFQRTSTSAFSIYSPKPAVIVPKTVTVTPPIQITGLHSKVLPAPDGSTSVPLQLPPGFFGYQWVRVSDNAIVSSTNTYVAAIGQFKAKIVEQFGCGTLFSPIFSVVDASGSPKPDAAKNLTATASVVNIQLDWNENPNAGENETGFEVYRSTASGGPYQLVTVTAPNVISYLDQNLQPNTRYYYIVRAVGNFGAAANSNEATALTQSDQISPTIPGNLLASCITRDRVTLKWNAATDNLAVTSYDIYLNGVKSYSTNKTTITMYELTPLQNLAFTVKAKDAAGNTSQASNQVSVVTRAQGVCYKVFSGSWDVLPNFSTLTPVAEGMSTNVNIGVRPSGLDDNFGFLWEGHLFRNSTGSSNYRFQTCSDDGSKMYFNMSYDNDATATVSNDGLHGNTCVNNANQALNVGTAYPVAVTFFEKTGGEAMSLNWSINNASFVAIPNANFTESFTSPGTPPLPPTAPGATAVSYKQINLTWTDASTNETGFEIVRSTTLNGTYVAVATVTGTSYSDSGLNASTQYFYKIRSVNSFGESAFTTAVNATTQAAPAAPAVPTIQALQVVSKDNINVRWTDNSTNETGFEVWRSVGNNLNFRLLATVAAVGGTGTTVNYSDAALFANVTYYYKVRATGLVTPSAFTAEVNATTQNTAPVMSNILDFTMKYGTVYSQPINAVDDDGDPLTFTFSNLPSFITIQNVNNGNVNIIFSPSIGDQGAYTIRAFVNDGHGGKDTALFTMLVNDNTVPTLNTIPDVVMNEGGTMVRPLHANDIEGNNFMVWSFTDMPSFATFIDSGNGKGSLTFKPGYAASGDYTMTAYVDDGNGAWASRTIHILVNELDPNQTIRINMKYFNGFVPTWNDIDLFNLPAPFSVSGLKDINGDTTTVGINALGTNYFGSVQGAQTGNNSGAMPDGVIHDYLLWGFFDFGTADTLRLRVSGLDTAGLYNFIFMGSTVNNSGGVTAATTTIFTIGNSSVTNHYYLNTTETDTIYQVKSNALGEVFITMIGDANTFTGGVLSGMVIEKALDDGTTPTKPLSLQGSFVENKGVLLNWVDRAYNEFTYNVYRGTNRSGPYTLVNPGVNLKDSTTYTDATTNPFTTYFYYVAGSNNHGVGAASDTISVVTGNNRPIIANLNTLFVKADASALEDFTVTDNAGDVVTVTVPNLPGFVTLANLGSGNYRLTANPGIDDLGGHDLIITAKDDKGGVSTAIMTITVADKNTRSIFVNFGDFGKTAPLPWNNFLHYGGAGQTFNNLKDENNTVTPISMQLLDSWSSMFNTGHITGNNSGVVPDSVLTSGIYYNGTSARRITITGLDNSKLYNIVLVGSQNEGYDASARYSLTVGSQSDTLNARNNTNQTGNLNAITPSGGVITVNFTKLSTANFMFLNGMIIEEYSGISLLNPINLYVEPKDRTTTTLTWSDRTNNETGFELQRATDSLFTQNLTTFNIGPNNSTFTNSSLTPDTRYWYRVRARNGGAFSDWSNRVKTITPLSMIFVNFNFTVANGPAPWNNLETLPSAGFVFPNLKNYASLSTGYDLSITKSFNGENNAGMNTGNNSGMGGLVPDNVLMSSFWIDNTQESQMKLSGLNQAKRYRIGFIASSNWIGGDLTTTFSVNGRTVYINAWQNTTKIVYIGNLVPDQNGELLLNFSTTQAASNGYNTGIIIEAYDDVPGGGSVLNEPNFGGDRRVVQEAGANGQTINASMYPNPFVDEVSIDFDNSAAGNTIGIDVYDITGSLVMKRNFGKLGAGYNTLRMNTAAGKLGTGVYLFVLNVNGKPVKASKLLRTNR